MTLFRCSDKTELCMWTEITQECCEQYKIRHGGNTQQTTAVWPPTTDHENN